LQLEKNKVTVVRNTVTVVKIRLLMKNRDTVVKIRLLMKNRDGYSCKNKVTAKNTVLKILIQL